MVQKRLKQNFDFLERTGLYNLWLYREDETASLLEIRFF